MTGSGLVIFLDFGCDYIFGQIVSMRVKTVSETNLVASRHSKRGKDSLPVGVQ